MVLPRMLRTKLHWVNSCARTRGGGGGGGGERDSSHMTVVGVASWDWVKHIVYVCMYTLFSFSIPFPVPCCHTPFPV